MPDSTPVHPAPLLPGVTNTAAQAVAEEHGIAVVAVATLGDLLAFAGESAELSAHRDALLAYRARYGVA